MCDSKSGENCECSEHCESSENSESIENQTKVNCARSARNTVDRAVWKSEIYKWDRVGSLGGVRYGANYN